MTIEEPRALPERLRRMVGSLGSTSAQTTAEYALVLLGAATVAMLLVAWAGESNRIGALFDAVMRSITGLVA